MKRDGRYAGIRAKGGEEEGKREKKKKKKNKKKTKMSNGFRHGEVSKRGSDSIDDKNNV